MPSGEVPLFNPDLLREYAEAVREDFEQDLEGEEEAVNEWTHLLDKPGDLGEENLEQAFNRIFFNRILGYQQPPGTDGYFQFFPKSYAKTGSGFPDFLLGVFKLGSGDDLEKDVRLAVGELKGPGTDLDEIDPDRLKSPVEQAFDYSLENGLTVKWVIVSNMEEIRLYHQGSKHHYQKWDIHNFVDEGDLTDNFWEFVSLLHKDQVIDYPEPSELENLLEHNLEERIQLTETFYEHYLDILTDTYEALKEERPDLSETAEGKETLLRKSQKLIHRGLAICYFSDHPAGLLPSRLLDRIINAAIDLPTLSDDQIYEALKDLFVCLNEGAPETYELDIFGYDGGLFEPDPVLGDISLPDELFLSEYTIGDEVVEGIYGFRNFDFGTDLNEHLLGHIFQESVSDLEAAYENIRDEDDPVEGIQARDEYGLFYTREVLTEYLAEKALNDILAERREEIRESLEDEGAGDENGDEFYSRYLDAILNLRIVDIACGSGAFLVSCYKKLREEARGAHEKILEEARGNGDLRQYDGYAGTQFIDIQNQILEECLFGNDLLAESVEISKLSLWISSAQRNRPLTDLRRNFISEDALATALDFPVEGGEYPEFDLVIGNPPWGGEISDEAEDFISDNIDLNNPPRQYDTFELFLRIASKYLGEGGRLAYVLPDTLMDPEKEETRSFVLENTAFTRYHKLGSDWFGPDVRVDTTVLHAIKMTPPEDSEFLSMTLAEDDRREAIEGKKSLAQLEEQYADWIPQQRCRATGEIQIFRYEKDDELMERMESNSLPLGVLSESHRGIEINKRGHIIQCPACGSWDAPPARKKGGGYKQKECTHCGTEYEYDDAIGKTEIVTDDPEDGDEPYIDGDHFGGRYEEPSYQGVETGYNGIRYKDDEIYAGEKVLFRQAGVGITVALDTREAYCPQSVYLYKFLTSTDRVQEKMESREDDEDWMTTGAVPDQIEEGLDPRFLLGILNSRIMNYYVFKRYGQIDASSPFAKMTQTKIRRLPIPVQNLDTEEGVKKYEEIVEHVRDLLDSDDQDLETDWKIERAVRSLFGLDGNDMTHISNQFGFVGYHDVVQQLYPIERPSKPERKKEITVKAD